MSNSADWAPFTGGSRIILAVVLLFITGVLVFSATRLHHPLVAARPGKFLVACIIVTWFLSVVAFLVSITIYVLALIAQVGSINGPTNPITPFTLLFALISFFVIFFLTVPSVTRAIRPGQFWGAVGSALVGTIAAPMIFEFPYDLIVLWHTHPPTPGALYTLLFFLPLFIVEILSFAMLTFSPNMKLSNTTLYLLAGLFFLFAIWMVFGFGYPSTPLFFVFNVSSKLVAFAVAVSLFLPQRKTTQQDVQRDVQHDALPEEQHGMAVG
jgi:hypothetical protein